MRIEGSSDAPLRAVGLLAVPALILSCAENGPPSQVPLVERRGDTTIVSHRGPLLPTDTLHLDLVIGSEQEGAYFATVDDVVPTSDGGVLVSDWMSDEVRRYGPKGTLLGEVGRQGQGPGEYLSVTGMEVLRDGRILLRDPRKLILFSPAGELLEEWPFHVDFMDRGILRSDNQGRITHKINLGRDLHFIRQDIGFVLLTDDGSVIDTTAIVTTPWDSEIVSTFSTVPRRHVVWSPLGVTVSAVSSRLAFQIASQDGSVILSEYPTDPVPYHSDKRAQWQKEMDDLRKRAPRSASRIPDIPENKPVFHQLLVSSSGEIWFQMSTLSDADATEAVAHYPGYTPTPLKKEPLLLVAFDSMGHFIRAVKGTSADEPRAVVGDTVWAVRKGEYQEETVARLIAVPIGG
jgi:hypothetical protein